MNRVHETALISGDVRMGSNNVIGPYSVILGPCTIGDDNWIGPHVAIGTPGEMRHGNHPAVWSGDAGTGPVVIGSRNVIREFATVQAGHFGDTVIGDDGYFMTKCHIPHDAKIGDRVTVSCAVLIGGHCSVGDGANLGLGAILHQGLAIGAGAMIGMGSVVTRPIGPFAMAYGSPARVKGANTIGMQRAGFEDSLIEAVSAAHGVGDNEALVQLLPSLMSTFADQIATAAH